METLYEVIANGVNVYAKNFRLEEAENFVAEMYRMYPENSYSIRVMQDDAPKESK